MSQYAKCHKCKTVFLIRNITSLPGRGMHRGWSKKDYKAVGIAFPQRTTECECGEVLVQGLDGEWMEMPLCKKGEIYA
jgi:hypothetical protein